VQDSVIAQAVSHQFIVAEAKVQSQEILVDREALEQVLPKYFGFPLSILFYYYCMLEEAKAYSGL